MSVLAQLWRDHRLALLAFVAALAVTLFFALRFVSFALYWSDPAHRNQVPEGWMTPGYVARSWDLPRDALIGALGLPEKPPHPLTLEEIAAMRGVPLSTVLGEVSAAITAIRNAPPPR